MPDMSKTPYITEVVEVDRGTLQALTPEDGWNSLAGVEVLEMGLSWDKSTGGHGGLLGWASRKVGSDLDGVAVLYTRAKPVKYLGWDELDCFANEAAAGSATHTGDNQTGEGAGDDETIRLQLGRLPERIICIVLTAAAFKRGSDMRRAKNILVTLYDSSGGNKTPVAMIEPSLLNPKNTIGVAVVRRKPGNETEWELMVIDSSVDVKQGDRDDFLVKSMNLVTSAR